MTIIFIAGLGIMSICLGRLVFGKWYNHVSLYAGIWSVTLTLFELRLINYYPIEIETWIVILTGWLAFLLGSMTPAAARFALNRHSAVAGLSPNLFGSMEEQKQLKHILWLLNVVTFLAALHGLYLVTKTFGSLANAIALGNLLYSYRVAEGFPGSIPYVSSLVFTATLLAGIYTAQRGRLTLVAIVPLIVVVMVDIANMGRVNMFVASILFSSAYFLTPKGKTRETGKLATKVRRLALLAVVIAIVIAGAEFVRSSRKAVETFAGSSSTLLNLRSASFITPSIYLYFSVHYGVLNQYLKHGGEHTPLGGHTFSSVHRLLAKLGFDTQVKTYQNAYRTPVGSNTATYLRELHGDFGIAGVLLGPYIIGILTSIFWYRLQDFGRYMDLSITVFFLVIVEMSFFVMATRMGSILVYLIGAIAVSYILDRSRIGIRRAEAA